jgi:hypothetical protein
MSKDEPPWASGPGEILRHGLDLLKKDTDTNRRLAMISIDNAVELMIKTFLGLPKRVTGLSISRKDIQEMSEGFPAILDALEVNASDRLAGIDLGVIEWYHRLRNQLYHQGNGLTVERDKVEIYAELANTLFENLFGTKLVASVSPTADSLGLFIAAWRDFEKELQRVARSMQRELPQHNVVEALRVFDHSQVFSATQMKELDRLRRIRNAVMHAQPDSDNLITPEIVEALREYTGTLRRYHGPS